MNTIFRNPYQSELEVAICSRTTVGRQTRISTDDTILPEYHALHLAPESVRVDGKPLSAQALSQDGTLLVPGSVMKDHLMIQIPFGERMTTLRNVTARLLMRLTAEQYLHITPEFAPVPSNLSRFRMQFPGHFSSSDRDPICSLLQRRVQTWAQTGINLHSDQDRRETTLFRMATVPWMGPHLFHTAELGSLSIIHAICHADALELEVEVLPSPFSEES